MSNKQRTCKRRRVRRNANGSPNEEDMEHNRKCEQKYMLVDNPWMKSVLNKKNPKGYDKFLKQLVKKRRRFLKKTKKNRPKKGKTRKNKTRK